MRLMRLDQEQCLNAFGIAYAQAAGEFQMYEEASQTVTCSKACGPDPVLIGRIGACRV